MVKMKGINVLNYGRMTQRNLIVNCLLKAAVGLLLIPSNAPQFSSLAINSGHNIIKHEFSAGVFIFFSDSEAKVFSFCGQTCSAQCFHGKNIDI